jgi:hypothetical protein
MPYLQKLIYCDEKMRKELNIDELEKQVADYWLKYQGDYNFLMGKPRNSEVPA